MNKIEIDPIGIIRTPYKNMEDIPIQGIFNKEIEGYIELESNYSEGLLDLDQFSHAILIYYFHESQIEKIKETPYLENNIHGIFAIRSPHRPNHLGISVV
ncbi:MAG: SAM-dependent methyltransferase, partial [Bacteroidales bacterium]|nr:SAM-dependent methyltransferase [Bacteroidales bacterium]